jgi:tetratricopeptide (TPR) repeat protein
MVSGIVDVDIGEAHRQIDQCFSGVSRDASYTTKQLRELLGRFSLTVDDKTIYEWKTRGIIRPSSGGGRFHRFDFEQAQRAMLAALLSGKGVPPAQILGAAAVWSSALIESKSVAIDIEQIERAQLLLCGRLLAVIVALATGCDGPPKDTVLVCRPIEAGQLRNRDVDLDMERLAEPPDLAQGQQLVGYTVNQDEAEVLARIRNYADVIARTRGLEFYSIQINEMYGGVTKQAVELVLGVHPEPEDQRAKDLIQRYRRENPFEAVADRPRLYRLLRFVFPTLMDFPLTYRQSRNREYARLPGSDMLDALATAVVIANPSWRSAAFWAYEDENSLHVRGTSPDYQGDRHGVLRLDQKDNLESWVFQTGQSIVMENVTPRDPRIPVSERKYLRSPFAMVRALSAEGPGGVLVVSAKEQGGEEPFGGTEIPLLTILAGVLAEAHQRLKVSKVAHLVHGSTFSSRQLSSEAELQQALEAFLSDRIVRYDEATQPTSYVVLFGVRIDSEFPQEVKEWHDRTIGRRMLAFFEQGSAGEDVGNAARLYRLGYGQLVILAERVSSVERVTVLRTELSRLLAELGKGFPGVSVHQWASYFSHSYLARKLQDSEDPARTANQADFMIALAKNDIANAHWFSAADRHIKEGNYAEAVPNLKKAIRDEANPREGDGYALRHLSEAFAGMRDWPEAERYARMAIDLDHNLRQSYAGSRVCLARALLGEGRNDEGLAELEGAADMSPDVEYQLALAEALITHGEVDEQFSRAIDILSGLLLRGDIEDPEKAFICYLRSCGETRRNDLGAAAGSLRKGLREYDRTNPYLRWQLNSVLLHRAADRAKGAVS